MPITQALGRHSDQKMRDLQGLDLGDVHSSCQMAMENAWKFIRGRYMKHSLDSVTYLFPAGPEREPNPGPPKPGPPTLQEWLAVSFVQR